MFYGTKGLTLLKLLYTALNFPRLFSPYENPKPIFLHYRKSGEEGMEAETGGLQLPETHRSGGREIKERIEGRLRETEADK